MSILYETKEIILRALLNNPRVSEKLVRYYLNSPPHEQRLLKRVVQQFDIESAYTHSSIYSNVIDNNVWIFTQPKSGTTLLCNILSNYNAQLLGTTKWEFGDSAFGVIRSLHRNPANLKMMLGYQRQTQMPLFIQTHRYYNANPSHLILTTRNALDYCKSMYIFAYKNRHAHTGLAIDTVLSTIVKEYCNRHLNQKRPHLKLTQLLF